MPDYAIEEIGESSYLYDEGERPMDPQAISAGMGRCLGEVWQEGGDGYSPCPARTVRQKGRQARAGPRRIVHPLG